MKKSPASEQTTKLSDPWIFRLLAILAFIIVAFNVYYMLAATSGVSLGVTSAGVERSVAQGSMLPYGVTFDNSGYEKLLEYYNSISLNSLTQEQKQRFIRVGTRERTGCGPCCGIQNGPAIDTNGNARCGCGHIQALIGLMKHLVKNYGDRYSDDQIFNEVVKWKKLFFPGQVADDGSVVG